MKKCLVIGSTVCDIIVYVDKLPKRSEDVHVKDQVLSLGGCAYNVVSVLHNLDIPYVFISPVGTGIYGDFVKEELRKKNIKTDVYLQEDNGCCYCIIDSSGERSFMSYHKCEYTFSPTWLNDYNLDDFSYIYICGLEIEDRDGHILSDTISGFSGTVVFAPGPRVNMIDEKLLNKIYQSNPIIHLNQDELKEITKTTNIDEALKKLYKLTQNIIIVTLGDKGSMYYDGKEKIIVKGYNAAVKDTVGAGDSHIGAVISCLSKGKTLEQALDFANLLSSKIVQTQGVNLSNKEYDELRKILA